MLKKFKDNLKKIFIMVKQKNHLGKFSIQFSKNMITNTIRDVREIINFKILSSSAKYLGIPLNLGSSTLQYLKKSLLKSMEN